MGDDKVKDKVSDSEREEVIKKCNKVIDWIDKNQTAKTEEFISWQKDLERICSRIAMKNLLNTDIYYL